MKFFKFLFFVIVSSVVTNLNCVRSRGSLEWMSALSLAKSFGSVDNAIEKINGLPTEIATLTALAYALRPDPRSRTPQEKKRKIYTDDRLKILQEVLPRISQDHWLKPVVSYIRDLFALRSEKQYLAVRPFRDMYRAHMRCKTGSFGSFLHCAIRDKNTPVILWLLERSADVNIPNQFGHVPMHEVVRAYTDQELDKFIFVVNRLLKAGADVNYVGKFFRNPVGRQMKSPLELARAEGNKQKIAEYLRERAMK